ncbi:MAG TPA: hypothetical protein PKH33_14165 [bacterium]|nr:hypothetical protein [bacterium]
MAKSFKEGDWVWHKNNGIGKVSLSSDSELLVEFEGGKDEIFDTAGKKRAPLVKLSSRGFHLRKRDEAEQFSKHINQEPLDAALALVEDQQAEITPAELKALVCPALVAENEFAEWQTRLAQAAKSDPRFEVDKAGKISYKGELGEIAQELLARFRQSPSLKDKQKIVRDMMQLEQKGVPMEDVRETAVTFFTGTAMNQTNKMGARLEALIFLETLDPEQHDAIKGSIYDEIRMFDVEQSAVAVSEVMDNAVRKRLFELLLELSPEQFLDTAFMLTKRFKKTQRDWTLDTLLSMEDKTYIKHIVDVAMADIATNMQPFVWVSKTQIEKCSDIVDVAPPADVVISSMFRILNNIHFTSAYSCRNNSDGPSVTREEDELVKLLKDEKKIGKFLDAQPAAVVSLFASHFFDCIAFDFEERQKRLRELKNKYPGIEVTEAKRHSEQDDVYRITREKYDQLVSELEDINSSKMEEALSDIRTAREWGDISENAELNIAQDKQRMLLGRKNEIERILDNCEVID